MRLLMTLCLAILTVLTVEAQKKPNINKAKSLWQNGEYAEAKEILDAAIEYEKIKDDGNTWYYRGLLYASIDTTSNEELSALSGNAMQVALESFAKAEELSNGKGYALLTPTTVATLDQQIAGYFGFYYSLAIDSYDVDDFSKASKYFENASIIMQSDTNSVANAGFAAMAGDDNERAINFFRKAISRGAVSKGMFANIINLQLMAEEKEKALETIREGLKLHPNAIDFKRQEIAILIDLGMADEAKAELVKTIEAEPNDPNLLFALGLLEEELGNKEEALAAYNSALEVDGLHYASAFNKAVIIFNDANNLYKEKAALGISKADIAKAKALDPKIKEGFNQALPAWEKVYSIQKAERPTLETLIFLYAYLGEEKKADKVEEELNALGDEE